MLTVQSASLTQGQTSVYLDVAISLTFNQEVLDASLTAANIRLYVGTGVSITGVHTILVAKDPDDANTLVVTPSGDLLPNQGYSLFLLGDTNLGDSIVAGLQSVTSESMDGNYVLEFTTGTEQTDPTEDEPDTQIPGDDDTPSGSSTSTSTYNRVVSTDPSKGTSNLTTVEHLSVKFEYPLDDTIDLTNIVTAVVESVDYPYTSVPDPFGSGIMPLVNPVLSDSDAVLTYDVASGYQTLPNNISVIVTVDKDEITSANGSGTLLTDYVYYFTSNYDPAFAHPRQIRQRGGSLFDSVTDGTLWFLIHENSLLLEARLGYELDDDNVPYFANRWVVCKTIEDLYNAMNGVIVGGGSIIEKSLGDLTIKYSDGSAGSTNKPDWVDDCLDEAFGALLGGVVAPPKIGVKSQYGRKYPGRRRSNF